MKKYKHVWHKEEKGIIKIGLTDIMQKQMRTIVNIKVKDVGHELKIGDPFGVVESWMFVHDLFSPVNGVIIEINQKVMDDPFILNDNTSIWILKVKSKISLPLPEYKCPM